MSFSSHRTGLKRRRRNPLRPHEGRLVGGTTSAGGGTRILRIREGTWVMARRGSGWSSSCFFWSFSLFFSLLFPVSLISLFGISLFYILSWLSNHPLLTLDLALIPLESTLTNLTPSFRPLESNAASPSILLSLIPLSLSFSLNLHHGEWADVLSPQPPRRPRSAGGRDHISSK